MIDNLNYIISNGDSFTHYYNDGDVCELFKLDLIENIQWKKTFLESYHSQIATLNSDSKNVYFVNIDNIDSVDFTSGNSFFVINFIDETSLRISFVTAKQGTDNYLYLDTQIFGRDILEYISDKTILYVHQDNVEDIPGNIFNNLQTAITNQLVNEVIVIQEGGICDNSGSAFIATKSVIIYCEADVSINEDFEVRPTLASQDVRIYGNPIVDGHIYFLNNVTPSTMNVCMELQSSLSVGGTCYNTGVSNVVVKLNTLTLVGNGFDSDSYLTTFDIDCINVTTDSNVTYMSNSGVTSIYFRNFNLVSDFGQIKLGETNGQYLVSLISCSLDEAYFDLIDNTSNEVRLWNTFILTDTNYSISNENSYDTYLYLYGKNGSNKPAAAHVEQYGVGELKIQTALAIV